MLNHIRTILAADATISAAVTDADGIKIFYENNPQGRSLPFITISKVDGDPNDTKDGASQLDQDIVQVTCYAKHMYTTAGGEMGAYSLMDLCRAALDHYDGTPDGADGNIFCRAMNTPQTLDISIPNKPLFSVDMEFEVYVSR